MSSLDRILPFLRPIEDLLTDPSVTEVMVNEGGRRVFVERDGALQMLADRTLEPRNLTVAVKNIANRKMSNAVCIGSSTCSWRRWLSSNIGRATSSRPSSM